MDYHGGAIWGIDQNTKSGIACGVPGGVPHLETVNFRRDPTDDHADIYSRAVFFFADRLKHDPPNLIVVERVVPPSAQGGATNHDTTMITVGLFAIVTGIVKCRGIPLVTVAPQTWRASFLGNGKLKRAVAKKAARDVCRRLGWHAETDDEADAGGIWFWACTKFAPYGITTMHPALFAERTT